VLTETWLKPEILSSEVLPSKYTIYRRDRTDRRGGGVLVAVDSTIASDFIQPEVQYDIEFICVKLHLPGFFLYITCSYIPPSSESSVYSQHLSAIKTVFNLLSDRDQFIVLGDFNIPDCNWTPSPEEYSLLPSQQHDLFDGLFDMSLSQVNHVLNSMKRSLDLCFVSDPSKVILNRAQPLSVPEDPYHPTLEVNFDLGYYSLTNSNTNSKRVRCFRKADFLLLNNLISNFDWSNLHLCTDMAVAIKVFYSTINSFFDICVPRFYPTASSKPPWFTKELSRLKNLKNALFKKYKLKHSSLFFSRYLTARSNFTVLNAKCYKNYLNRCRAQFFQNPKQFYNFVNMKRKSAAFPCKLEFENAIADTDQAMADMFARFFQTTYLPATHNTQSYPYNIPCSNGIFTPLLNESSIARDLHLVTPLYSPGPDGIPACVLRFCANSLSKPLLKLFSLSLETSFFPSIWKESFIIPLLKKGSKSDATNYRGISKLSAIPKFFENVLTPHLQHFCRSIISPCQHGFIKRRSTTTNLLELTSFVVQGFQQNLQTDVIYTDFSKAFDSVNHSLLSEKLKLLGFSPKLLSWIVSYLTDRTQMVLFKDCLSNPLHATSGVPQGSHLGPLLFTLFINDLPLVIRSARTLMYADDVKLCFQLKDAFCHSYLQADLDSFQSWCRVNLLILNSSKCKLMTFYRTSPELVSYTLCGCALERIALVDDLGIRLDRKLKFSEHISTMVNKAMGILGFIKRWSKEFDDPYLTKTLYTSLVRPILEYGSCVWCPQYSIHRDRIESVQKNFLIFALRGLNWDVDIRLPPYTNRLRLLNLPSLANRRTMLGVVFMNNLIQGDVESVDLVSQLNFAVPCRITRNYLPLTLPNCRSNYALHEPFRVLCSDFNKYSFILTNTDSVPALKLKLLSYLGRS
jgi:hypothetical protein